jgi:hypothetical protein
MEDKQKVTLYLPPKLHKQLKIKAAVDLEPMSTIAEKALEIYLQHPELIEMVTSRQCGSHQVYNCPECSHPAVIRNGELVSIGEQPGIIADELVVNESSTQRSSVLIGKH